jgi:pyruvate kinase
VLQPRIPARTKIVATLGPASGDAEVLEAMVDAGVDVARLNFSHGDTEEHLARLATARRVAAARGSNLAVLADERLMKSRGRPQGLP